MKKTITSTDRFKKIYNLTIAICKTDKEINYRSLVQKKHERWKVLVDIWTANRRKFKGNIFNNPLGLIFYGYYITSNTKKSEELIKEIHLAILNDKEALEAWCETKAFNKVFFLHVERAGNYTVFGAYQRSQALFRIFNSINKLGFPLYRGKINKYSKRYNFNYTECELSYSGFKAMILTLLPESAFWNSQMWCNDSYICSEINKKHCAHLTDLYKDFAKISALFSFNLESPMLINVILPGKGITPSMVNAIYKERTDDFVYSIFCHINESYNKIQKSELLANSWMLEIMTSWSNDKDHPYHTAVKKTVFDMIMQPMVQQ